MKKVVSLILVVALFAGLAISASATAVVHEQNDWEIQAQIEHGRDRLGFNGNFCNAGQTMAAANAAVAANSQRVRIVNAPEGITWTKCAEALTVKEMKAIIDSEDAIKNLTVFYQRNCEKTEGENKMTVTLWPCNPKSLHNQDVVVLWKNDSGEWGVAPDDNSGDRTTEVTLPAGAVAFAVCMAW